MLSLLIQIRLFHFPLTPVRLYMAGIATVDDRCKDAPDHPTAERRGGGWQRRLPRGAQEGQADQASGAKRGESWQTQGRAF